MQPSTVLLLVTLLTYTAAQVVPVSWATLGGGSDQQKVTALYNGVAKFKYAVSGHDCLGSSFTATGNPTDPNRIQSWASWLCSYWNPSLAGNGSVTGTITNDCLYIPAGGNYTQENLEGAMTVTHGGQGYSTAEYNLVRDMLVNALDLALGSPAGFSAAAVTNFDALSMNFVDTQTMNDPCPGSTEVNWDVNTRLTGASELTGAQGTRLRFKWNDAAPHSVLYYNCTNCGSPAIVVQTPGFGGGDRQVTSPLAACTAGDLANAYPSGGAACVLDGSTGPFTYTIDLRNDGAFLFGCIVHPNMAVGIDVGATRPSASPSRDPTKFESGNSNGYTLNSWLF